MSATARPPAAGVGYWRARAQALGARAVVSTDHPAGGDLAAVADAHRAVLLPVVAAELRGDERLVLDLGCGIGRFTADLAALVGGRAVGADPVPELLALARPAPGVEFRVMQAGRLPLADDEADVAFTSMVLGGLPDGVLHETLAEVRRVLAPGGLLVLAESVGAPAAAGTHWRSRPVHAYRRLVPWAALREVARFDDAGDAVAVLAGRTTPRA